VIAAWRRCVRRLGESWRPARSEEDVARELASHLALLEDEYRRRGASADEAVRRARLALGGVEQARERLSAALLSVSVCGRGCVSLSHVCDFCGRRPRSTRASSVVE
jgi:hypothetical protein